MPVTLTDIQRRYDRLKTVFKVSAKDDNVAGLLIEIYHLTKEYLSDKTRLPLNSRVPGKDYFAFTVGEKRSRAVNPALFDLATTANPITGFTTVDEFWANVMSNTVANLTAHEITCAVYAVAISFCSSIDLLKTADQKTPGTYFEYLIGHLMARQFDINPRNQMDVLNLGLRTTLPTDFIFDLGTEEPKFHVPVKTSTRERVVQVWSHQRVLDGVYGTGRFLGLLSCLAETKVDSRSLEVTEICLPDQWRLYQMFIAQMKRIYYLDIPEKYRELNTVFPKINVKEFGEFFHEINTLSE